MNTVRFTTKQFSTLRDYLFGFSGREAAAFVLAGSFINDSGIHFTARTLMMPEEKDYDIQTAYHLQVSAIYFNRVISKAEQENLTVIICHSHPWEEKGLFYSKSDDYGERISSKTLAECLENKPTASLLFGNKSIIGRVIQHSASKTGSIGQIRIVDRHLKLLSVGTAKKGKAKSITSLFSRQILTFGKEIQRVLESLRIGIVGLGGTGSCVAEQLARMGVQNFLVIDKDNFEPSNLTRVYGSSFEDLRDPVPKTLIAERNIKRVSPEAKVESICGDVTSQRALKRLENCDVIFACTDRHAPRSVLNELAYQYFIPVIDLGAGLDAPDEKIKGGSIRVSLLSPSLPCLFCLNIIRSDTIAAECMSVEERQSREREGYIRGVNQANAPSVIGFTSTAAGLGIAILVDLLCGYVKPASSNFILDIRDFDICRISCVPKEDCTCQKRTGRADYKPLSAP
jgi:hypothetical protein